MATNVSRARRRSAALVIFTVLAVMAGLVVVAVRAEGRELSRATSNDGGAWVVNRSLGAVGHTNRATGEMSSFVRFDDRPVIDVYQDDDVVVVHDLVTNQLLQIDPRSVAEDLQPTQLPEASTVTAVEGAIIVTRQAPLEIWRIDRNQLSTLANLDGEQALYSTTGDGLVAIAPTGVIALVDQDLSELRWIDPQGIDSPAIALPIDDDTGAAIDVTIVDGSAVVLFENGDLLVASVDQVQEIIRWQDVARGLSPLTLLQQPTSPDPSVGVQLADEFAGVTSDGELVNVQLGETTSAIVRGSLGGSNPLPPIVHEGCIYGVVASPAVYGAACTEFVTQSLGEVGDQLRLRLVNGWVWVNDVESGETYATNDLLEFEELDDWSTVEKLLSEDREDSQDSGSADVADPDAVLIEDADADAEVQNSDGFDPSEVNVPPVAIDDVASTRAGQAVVVDVLANDFDRNNDILIVESVELFSGTAQLSVVPGGDAVNFTPAVGFVGNATFEYTISDGRSEPVSATVTVTVLPDDSNRSPETATDVVAVAPGESSTIDVLRNDSDPDGDALTLASISTDSGTLRWDPSGQITFTPDTTTAQGWIELPYVATDSRGASTEGLVRVEIREREANQEPDARNDHASTVVGRSVSINLLANDSDPDGDPLIIGSQPRLIEPTEATVIQSVTADGEFVFEADQPGTYLLSYTVNDASRRGSESDTARIRIDVLPNTTNQPPVAVRDHIVVPTGETRTVYVLENDGDPDGDVVSIVDWKASQGVLVSDFIDGSGHVGFYVTIPPGSVGNPQLSYSISDGVNPPVSAPVLISVVDRAPRDNPPFANDDLVQARAGTTISGVDVLANDFDPEGGAIKVVYIDETDGVSAEVANDEQSINLVIGEDVASSFSLTYGIEDLAGNAAAAVVRVQLIPSGAPNRPPVARTDRSRAADGEAVLINVLINDSDPDNDAIVLEGIDTQPLRGSASVTDAGAVRYQPDIGFVGTDQLRYSIVDAGGDRAVGEVFIGVTQTTQVDLGPIANDDSYDIAGRPTLTQLPVRENDFDPEGGELRVVSTSSPNIGSVSINVFGQVEYLPPSRLDAPTDAVFTYRIEDNAGNDARATVTIALEAFDEAAFEQPEREIEPTPTPTPEVVATPTPDPTAEPTPLAEPTPDLSEGNLPPTAQDDVRGPVRAGSEVVVDVLTNDDDSDGPLSELQIVSADGGARVEGTTVVVTVGEEDVTVSYTIADRFNATATANIIILVTENQAPEVQPFTATTPFETPLVLDLSSLATDADGDELSTNCCEGVRGGVINDLVVTNNTFTMVFTPNDGLSGSAGFSYEVDDRRGGLATGSVAIQIDEPINQAPVTTPDTVNVNQGETVTVDLLRLSGDPDGDTVTRRLLTEPGSGVSVSLTGSDAAVTVDRSVPVGPAGSFTYEISDGEFTATGEVTIEVTLGANTEPVVRDTAISLAANSGTTVDIAPLVTETDLGDSVTYSLDDSSFGALSVSLVGSLVQITAPTDGAGTSELIEFTATDTRNGSGIGRIEVTVTEPTAPLPSAVNDPANAERNGSVLIDVLANDSDPLNLGLDVVEATASFGTAEIENNQIRFSPGDQVGEATVDYTIRDQANRPASAQVTIDTIGAPDKPAPPDIEVLSGQVLLDWDTPEWNGPTGYYTISIIDPAGTITPTTRRVEGRNGLTWEGLVNGNSYEFTVTATNSVGSSLPSDPSIEARPNQSPEAPPQPIITFGDGRLTVEWSEPDNGGSAITGYVLHQSPDLETEEFGPDARSFTWPDLDNGREYTFQVQAINAAPDPGPLSLPSSEHPLREPDAPVIGSAQRAGLSNALVIDWAQAANNGGEPPSRFRIQIGENDVGGEIRPINDPAATDYTWSTGLTDGERVQFRVSAKNRDEDWSLWSDWSNEIESCSAPGAVTDLVAGRQDKAASLSWDDAAPNGCEVTNYRISIVRPQNAPDTQNSGTLTFHPFAPLRNGQEYTFTVTPTNEIGDGPSSETNPVTPAGPPVCAVTGALTASVNAPGSVDLSWAGGFANNGRPITDYRVSYAGTSELMGSNAENARIEPLQDGMTYTFDVVAVNSVDDSVSCGTVTATTWSLPTAVDLDLSFDPDTDEITVLGFGGDTVWTTSTNFHRYTLSGASISPPGPVTSTGEPQGNRIPRVFQLLADGSVTVRLEACNEVGCVETTETLGPLALIDPPEKIPVSSTQLFTRDYQRRDFQAGGDIGTYLWWQLRDPGANGGTITHFEWQVNSNSSGIPWSDQDIVPANPDPSTGWTWHNYNFFHGMSDHPESRNFGLNIDYNIRFRAINEAGPGEWSDWQVTTVIAPPATVTARKLGGFCSGSLASCEPVQLTVYGLDDLHSYQAQVSTSINSGNCSQAFTGGDGSFSQRVDCNFSGSIDAPFSFDITIAGITVPVEQR